MVMNVTPDMTIFSYVFGGYFAGSGSVVWTGSSAGVVEVGVGIWR